MAAATDPSGLHHAQEHTNHWTWLGPSENLDVACSFLSSLRHYTLLPSSMPSSQDAAEPAHLDAGSRRAQKIARFKQERAMQARLESLRSSTRPPPGRPVACSPHLACLQLLAGPLWVFATSAHLLHLRADYCTHYMLVASTRPSPI